VAVAQLFSRDGESVEAAQCVSPRHRALLQHHRHWATHACSGSYSTHGLRDGGWRVVRCRKSYGSLGPRLSRERRLYTHTTAERRAGWLASPRMRGTRTWATDDGSLYVGGSRDVNRQPSLSLTVDRLCPDAAPPPRIFGSRPKQMLPPSSCGVTADLAARRATVTFAADKASFVDPLGVLLRANWSSRGFVPLAGHAERMA
jgi:hypothetical protein